MNRRTIMTTRRRVRRPGGLVFRVPIRHGFPRPRFAAKVYVLFHFNEGRIRGRLSSVAARDALFLEAHRSRRRRVGWSPSPESAGSIPLGSSKPASARRLEPPDEFYPGLWFVLLHSFVHALIRRFSLECGYTTASLRERIDSRDPGGDESEMAGVLIDTAALSGEGTHWGLVSLGRPETLERHLDQALDNVRLCASDPLCAEHHPYRDGVTLHAASCHAC